VKPPATLILPPAPTDPKVERAYLTSLFDDSQRVWRREFEAAKMGYQPARLVIFWSVTQSPCGRHRDGAGPFYCPPRWVYLDTRFFTELLRIRGVGAAAQAYIVGHEVAHHIQRLVGIADRVNAANKADPAGRNGRSVQIELQADCLAGVWARSAFPRSELTVTDLHEALRAAELIGDDYGTRAAGELVDSTLWTHGSSEQRQRWLATGFISGRPGACDTFARG
jgi:predicted metalloprotease